MDSIELKSPEINELLTRPPKGLIRWGSGLLLAILLLLLGGSCLFRYPEVINANVVITTVPPPVWLKARTTASIRELYGHHLMVVRKGQLIAVLNNAATTRDIRFLKQKLSDSTFYKPEALVKQPLVFSQRLNVGELQSYWTTLVSCFTDYFTADSMDNFESKKKAATIAIRLIEQNLRALRQKMACQQQALKIQRHAYEREKALYTKGLIASETFETAEQTMLSSQLELEETTIAVNNLLSTKLVQIQSIENDASLRSRTLLTKKQAYLLALKELVSALETWEQTYLVISPVNGTLTFPERRNALQEVQTGDKLFAIIPEKTGPLQAYLKFPAAGSGHVRTGQEVRLFIDGYPYLEYGTVEMTIQTISLIPDAASMYTATGGVSQPLVTNYGKRIPVTGELSGTAAIKTDELRLIQRLFNPLKYLIKQP